MVVTVILSKKKKKNESSFIYTGNWNLGKRADSLKAAKLFNEVMSLDGYIKKTGLLERIK